MQGRGRGKGPPPPRSAFLPQAARSPSPLARQWRREASAGRLPPPLAGPGRLKPLFMLALCAVYQMAPASWLAPMRGYHARFPWARKPSTARRSRGRVFMGGIGGPALGRRALAAPGVMAAVSSKAAPERETKTSLLERRSSLSRLGRWRSSPSLCLMVRSKAPPSLSQEHQGARASVSYRPSALRR